MNSQLWICSICDGKIITYVGLSEPPTCTNTGRHAPVHMDLKKGRGNATNKTGTGAGGESSN